MTTDTTLVIGAVAVLLLVVVTGLAMKLLRDRKAHHRESGDLQAKIQSFGERLKPITSLDTEVERLKSEIKQLQSSIDEPRSSYCAKKAIYDHLLKEVAVFDESIINAQEQIDKLNESNATLVPKDYIKLKLQELYLTHEYTSAAL